jgi:hypothetical protein
VTKRSFLVMNLPLKGVNGMLLSDFHLHVTDGKGAIPNRRAARHVLCGADGDSARIIARSQSIELLTCPNCGMAG